MKRFASLLAVLAALLTLTRTAAAGDPIRLYYAGPPGSVRTALELAGVEFVADSTQAEVIVLNRICFPQRFYFWQSLMAPLLSGIAHYSILAAVNHVLWKGDQMTSVLIFFLGILPSFPLFLFLYGLFGGWDPATLAEFKDAAALTGNLRALTYWGMYAPTALGARLSPWHGRFPIANRAAAMEEAQKLTREKVKL